MPPTLAVSFVIDLARLEMIELGIPWRDKKIADVVATLMERKASDIRLGKGRRKLLSNAAYVEKMNRRQPKGRGGDDMRQVAAQILSDSDEVIGKEYRRHAIRCFLVNCYCLSF